MIEEQVQWKDMNPEQLREYHNRKNREYRARRKLLELLKTKKTRV